MAGVVDLLAAGIAQAQARPVQVLWATAVDRRSVILDTAADPGEPDAPTAEAVAAEISSSAIGDLTPGERVLTIRDGMRLHVVASPSRASVSAWADLPLTGGWESYGGGFGAARWRIIGDAIELRGMIRRGQAGTDAARIELGRPVTARTRVFSAMTASGPERIDMAGDGTALRLIVPAASTGATTWVSLEGIRTSI